AASAPARAKRSTPQPGVEGIGAADSRPKRSIVGPPPRPHRASSDGGLGGHSRWPVGGRAKRYASERAKITAITAKTSAGHSRNWSLRGLPAIAYHVDASVGSLVCEVINAAS